MPSYALKIEFGDKIFFVEGSTFHEIARKVGVRKQVTDADSLINAVNAYYKRKKIPAKAVSSTNGESVGSLEDSGKKICVW